MLTIQAKPVRDLPELLPVCFLSGQTNPLLNPAAAGDVSISCGHPFIRSFTHFEVLPLVEFVPAPGLTDEDAIELIRTPPPTANDGRRRNIASVSQCVCCIFVYFVCIYQRMKREFCTDEAASRRGYSWIRISFIPLYPLTHRFFPWFLYFFLTL